MTLVCVMIVQSFAHRVVLGAVLSDLLITLMVLAVFLVVFTGWRERTIAFAVAAAVMAIDWSHYLPILAEHGILLAAVHQLLLVLFLGFAVAVILRNIFEGMVVTGDEVLGAVCGYLLAAGAWANAYGLTELLAPGSFTLSPGLGQELSSWNGRHALFYYFSLVTLTTMGYGDVTPVRSPATALATLEAVFGQFYIAVVVAQLVGLRLATRAGEPPA